MPLPKRIPRSSSNKKQSRVIVNRYEIQKKLGHGNYGTAWLVKDKRAKEEKDKLKVLKEIPVGDLHEDEALEVKHEADLQRNLDHPSIVRFQDCFVEGEFFCLVTEYCEGGDLDVKVHEHKKKSKAIPEPQVVEWLIQLLLAVQYMHDRRVLHRDLKARNIFLRNNMIKVGDFGISRILMGTTDMASTFVGTPYYMSPEVLKHEGYNAKSDVWSVGCILYEMVALEHAFEGQSLMGVMYKIVEGELPSWPKTYSKDLKEVFLRIMEKDPAKRPSASEVLKMPFIAKQIELLKNTMIQKHHSKEQRESIREESARIVKATKEKKTVEELKREAEEKRYRNLPPRERMRLMKQKRADEEAEKLRKAAQLQLKENRAKYDELRTTMNPYNKHGDPPWARDEKKSHRRAKSEDLDYNLNTRPYTAPIRHHSDKQSYDHTDHIDEEDEELSEEDSDDDIQYGSPSKQHFGRSLDSPLRGGYVDSHGPGSKTTKAYMSSDDRPITPMRDKMVYDVANSSLDFKDGVPEKPDLAETYYSQFEDFENGDSGSDEDDADGTLVATVMGKEGTEIEDLIQCMKTALDKGDTIKSVTLIDDSHSGAFGPAAREVKIRNLRAEAEKKLGKDNFDKAYTYLKEARGFSAASVRTVDENNIMQGLRKIVKNPNDCFIVDQLLFLEAQSNLPS